jgi:hypothetical protein
LVLQVAKDPAGKARERRFVTQLRLVLENIPVETAELSNTDFAEQPLARQLNAIRPLLRARQTLGALWISAPSEDLIILQMVSVTTGRAVVRMVEAKAGQEAEANLALASRELLGTVYLFGGSPGGANLSLKRVVESVRKQVAPAPPPPPPPPRKVAAPRQAAPVAHVHGPANWLVLGAPLVRTGLVGQVGPAVWLGGRAAVERRLVWGAFARLVLDAASGPLGPNRGTPSVSGASVGVSLELAYRWRWRELSAGPHAGVGLEGSVLSFGNPAASRLATDWRVLVGTGAEVRWQLTRWLSLATGLGAALYILRDRYVLASNNVELFATPLLALQATMGVVASLPGP